MERCLTIYVLYIKVRLTLRRYAVTTQGGRYAYAYTGPHGISI